MEGGGGGTNVSVCLAFDVVAWLAFGVVACLLYALRHVCLS